MDVQGLLKPIIQLSVRWGEREKQNAVASSIFLSTAHVMLELLSFYVTGPAQVMPLHPSLQGQKAHQGKGTKISNFYSLTKSHLQGRKVHQWKSTKISKYLP